MAEENTIDIKNIEALIHVVKDIKVIEPQKCLFDSISDIYYRENFHSDILAYYLSYDLVKEKLIDWINRCLENKQIKGVDFALYKGGPAPVREEGRRDITLYSDENKTHAIIIENKSNGACDMDFQIPRYYEALCAERSECAEFTVDAIIYLNKDGSKYPKDIDGWNKNKIIEIAAEFENRISQGVAEKHIRDIRNKLIIASLNGENGFTQNVIDFVRKDSDSIRLIGLSEEIKILFENIVQGVYMAEEQVKKVLELFNGNADIISNFDYLHLNLPNIMCKYYKDIATSHIKVDEGIRCCRYGDKIFFIEGTLKNGKKYAVNFEFDEVFYNHMNIRLLVREYTKDTYNTELKEFVDRYGVAFNMRDDSICCIDNVFNETEISAQICRIIECFRTNITKD